MDKDQELRGWKSHCVELQDRVDRLELENSRLKASIDAANAQEPFRWFLADRVNQSEDMLTEVTGNIDPAREVLMPMYLRPIPAQQSQVSTSDKVLFNGSHGHAGYVIDDQQSQAVAAPCGWIKQSGNSLFDISSGSLILIKFNDSNNGITADDGTTVDLSWIRADGIIFATSGCYRESDINEWMPIPLEKNHE